MSENKVKKNKKVCLTVQKRLEIINLRKNGAKNRDLASKFGISPQTVSSIIKNQDHWNDMVIKLKLE